MASGRSRCVRAAARPLDNAIDAIGGSLEQGAAALPAVTALELASAVVGQDLATARLIVASLTPWGSAGRNPAALAVKTTDK
jgi:hypothetical protein